MASLWNQLVKLLSGTRAKQVHKVSRARTQRRLRMEMLEGRALMAADITGTIFHDLTDNNIDGADPRLSGVTVALFRDGGNATYESGAGTIAAGDDVLVGTTTSAATTGLYSFTVNQAGTYYVVQTSASGSLIQRPNARVQTITVTSGQVAGVSVQTIDSFDTTSQTVTASTSGTNPDFNSIAAAEALGGERDLFANATSGSISIEVDNPSTTNQVVFNVGAGANGTRQIVYDGADGDGQVLDNTGLGGVDLTSGGTANGFRLTIGGEAGTSITITVNSGANASSRTVSIPTTAGGAPTDILEVLFSDFTTSAGTGADFEDVGAITFEVTGPDAADATIDLIETFGPTVLTQNIANLSPMTIGDLVFADLDNDGLFDASGANPDVPLANVTLQLFTDTNSNGTFDNGVDLQTTDGSGNPVSTTTNGSGIYQFTNVLPGSYFVVIPSSQFATGQAAAGYIASSTVPVGQANNANTAANITGVGVVTALVTLAATAAPTDDGDTDNNTDLSNDIGLVPQYDLTIEKTSTATSAPAGTTITYTINARNDGPSPATDVSITDNIPDGIQIVSVTSNVGTDVITVPASAQDTTAANPDDIVIEVGNLAASATTQRTITVVAFVLPDTVGTGTPASIENTATIAGFGTELTALPNTDSLSLPVTRNAILELTKTASPTTAVVGSNITYTLTMRNTGPSTARNVVINDTLPAGLDLVSVTSNVGTATGTQGTTGNPDSIEVTVANVNVDAPSADTDVVVTIVATVLNSITGSSIANTGTADSDDSAGVTANANTPLARNIDLAITKAITTNPASTATPATAAPNSTFTYTVVARNDGPSAATTVRVTDNLPDGIRIISATSSDGTDTITIPASAQDTTASNPDDLIIEVGDLDVGSANQTTITIVGVVLPGTTGTFTNVATIAATDTTGNIESDTSDNSASVAANAPRTVDLAVTKSGPATAVSGNTITYTMSAVNNGPSDAIGVQVSDDIPDGLRVISATVNGTPVTIPASLADTTAANPDNLVFAIGALASGATNNTIQIVAAILPSSTAALVNSAVISTTDTATVETPNTNNTSTVTTTLTQQNDVAITKTGPATLPAGSTITYTMNVTNNGPSTATSVAVADTLPTGVTFVSGTSLIGSTAAGTVASGANNSATVTIPALAPGETAVVTILATVSASATGSVTNTVTVTAANDTVSTNNTSTASTTLTAPLPSNITGRIYIDSNRDGVGQSTESGIAGVTVTLTGTPTGGSTSVTQTTTTNANGEYTFSNVAAGTYTVTSANPTDFNFQAANPGSTGGTAGTRQITAIPLAAANSTANNVGFVRVFSKRLFLSSSTR
ncbi:SdrD B-like domain-containing protein [Pirellulaceae bacterium SH501]